VSLGIEQIVSAPAILLPLLAFYSSSICTQVFLWNVLAEWGLLISPWGVVVYVTILHVCKQYEMELEVVKSFV
jgi:hypothetical protein